MAFSDWRNGQTPEFLRATGAKVMWLRRSLILGLSFLCSSLTTAQQLNVVTEHLPPYQIVENGTLSSGTSYIFVKQLLELAEFDAKITAMPWARAYRSALEQENTIIFSIFRTPVRENLFKWITPLETTPFRFFTSSQNTHVTIKKIEDALAYEAVAVRDSAEADFLKSIGFSEGINLLLVKDYTTAWSMVHKQRYDILYSHASYELAFNDRILSDDDFISFPMVVERHTLYVAASLNTSDYVVLKLREAAAQIKNSQN